jgi:drug/metabolite transporter (DMT)-like permease
VEPGPAHFLGAAHLICRGDLTKAVVAKFYSAMESDHESLLTLPGVQRSGESTAGQGAQFGALALIWGVSFLLIKLGERSFAPLQVSFGRTLIGAVTLVVVSSWRRQRLPGSWKTWGHLLIAGLLLNALPFSLFAYGEQHVSSVLAGIWNATTPLFALPVAVVMIPEEHLTRKRAVGLLLGFAGVLVVLGVWQGLGATSLTGNVLCLAAAACYGLGFPYARRHLATRPEGPLSLATGQLLCGALELGIITPLLTHAPTHTTTDAILAILALGALGTGVAYILNYALIRSIGATNASTVTYVIPVFSTLAGVICLNEPLSLNQPVGAIIILLGAAITQGRLRRPHTQQVRRQ